VSFLKAHGFTMKKVDPQKIDPWVCLSSQRGNLQGFSRRYCAMSIEQQLVQFIRQTAYEHLSPTVRDTGKNKNPLLTAISTTVARPPHTLIDDYRALGGTQEAGCDLNAEECLDARGGIT